MLSDCLATQYTHELSFVRSKESEFLDEQYTALDEVSFWL